MNVRISTCVRLHECVNICACVRVSMHVHLRVRACMNPRTPSTLIHHKIIRITPDEFITRDIKMADLEIIYIYTNL